MSIVKANESRSDLRARLLKIRESISGEEKKEKDARLATKVDDYVREHCQVGAMIGLYYPFRGEPDLLSLVPSWVADGFKVLLPVVVEKKAVLHFSLYQPSTPLKEGAYGILEPDSTPIDQRVDILIIPCIGFNNQKYRLGYGGGYYDRTLTAHPTQSIGVAYAFAACEFGLNAHDVSLDVILSV